MDDQAAAMIEEWKAPNLMPNFLHEEFCSDVFGESGAGDGAKAGYERHGDGQPSPLTPSFGVGDGGRKSNANSSLVERMAARAGFSVPKLSMPCIAPSAVANPSPGAPSPYLTIPAGLSPTMLLESPVFLSNSMAQASPTTGKLFMLDGVTVSDHDRIEGLPCDDGADAFSFRPSPQHESSYFPSQENKSSSHLQNPSLPATGLAIKSEQALKDITDGSKLEPAVPGAFAGTDHSSPPEHDHLAEDGDARGECPAMATGTPAEDGYSWRKYGQKQVKHSEYPRSYYKCTHPNCPVKKKVERSHEGHITEIIYKGAHNHPKPPQSRRPGVPATSSHPFVGDALMDGPEHASLEGRSLLWASNGAVQDWRGGDGGGGLETTSSPSVPGELCDSSASMQQVQDGPGIDVTSALSDEEEDDDRATRGGTPQGTADGEGDELESKRRKLESCAVEMSAASRAVREPRVVIQTTSDIDILDDGYRWRKYGQKVVKGNPNPRSYYKCTHPGCCVRKHVERASHDLKSVITTYEGKHNHEVPAARNGGGGGGGHPSSAASGTATAAASHQCHAANRRPEAPPPPAQDGSLGRLGGCAAAPLGGFPPMGAFPYGLGQPGLRGFPMPAGLGGMADALKLPVLAPATRAYLRHRQGADPAAFMAPKAEPPEAAAAQEARMLMPASGGATAAVYQQMLRKLPLGPQM